MSPAIAHRGGRHDKVIAAMAEGLVDICVSPYLNSSTSTNDLGTVPGANYDNEVNGRTTEYAKCKDKSRDQMLSPRGVALNYLPLNSNSSSEYGSWESLFPAVVPSIDRSVSAPLESNLLRPTPPTTTRTPMSAPRPASASRTSFTTPPSENLYGSESGFHKGNMFRNNNSNPRPSSALQMSSVVTNGDSSNSNNIYFMVTGTLISPNKMDFIDACCTAFGSVLVIQRFVRV